MFNAVNSPTIRSSQLSEANETCFQNAEAQREKRHFPVSEKVAHSALSYDNHLRMKHLYRWRMRNTWQREIEAFDLKGQEKMAVNDAQGG